MRGFAIGLALAATALSAPTLNASAMEGCGTISATPDEKVVVLRLVAAGLSEDEQRTASNFVYRAALQVTTDLSNIHGLPPLQVVSCDHTAQNIDGSDFVAAYVRELDDRNVLYEVWGNLSTRKFKQRLAAQGTLAYRMIPAPEPKLEWPVSPQFNRDFQSQAQPMKDLFEGIFTQGHHFEILTAVALGISEHRNANVLAAQAAFCRAKSLLDMTKGQNQVWRELGVDPSVLAKAIERLAKDNFAKASPDARNALKPMTGEGNVERVCPTV